MHPRRTGSRLSVGTHFYPSLGTGLSIVDEIMHFWPPSHILMLVVLINNLSKCAIVCSLCFNSKCVYVWNALAGSMSGLEMSIYGQMVADETWAYFSPWYMYDKFHSGYFCEDMEHF